MDSKKTIYVYDDFSFAEPTLIGMLYVDIVRGNEEYSFEYSDEYLMHNKFQNSLDPELLPYKGRQFSIKGDIFCLFKDASPDRWGRTLMKKRERISAEKENRKPNKLFESDFLLGVYDQTRMGGLRFKNKIDEEFVSDDSEMSAPPWAKIRELENASLKFEVDASDTWLNQLIKPGSSLGGARPKATVVDPEGNLWIAKFPSRNDEFDIGAWEKVANDLAKMCGLNVVDTELKKFSKYGSTFLSKRFDRDGSKRIHFASAMTLLGKNDGSSASDGTSYLDIVDFIKTRGSNPSNDLLELWKRIVFNMAISNTDDHLRNHAFIYQINGWKLSPVYDINPVPYGNELSLLVDEYDNTILPELAISVSYRFGINEEVANLLLNDILTIVKQNWEKLAKVYGIGRDEIEKMRPAFSICEKY